jgi:hypothetical protein
MEQLLVKIENAGSAAGAGAGGGSGGKTKPPEQPKSFFNKMKDATSGGLKSAGIQFGVASLLKQSQLFTSFAGSIFQIVGGMIDLMLAPLMPIFIPVLKFLAKMMPGVRKTSQWIADKLMWFGGIIVGWWKDNAPGWLQGGDGTQIAQVAGGIFTALMFTKFTGLWKFGKWFLGMKVGQEVAEAGVKGAVKGAAQTAAKTGATTVGGAIKSGIWRFIKWIGSGFKAILYRIPGVEKLVGLVGKAGIMLKSFKDTVITTLFVWMDDSLKFFKKLPSTIAEKLGNGVRAVGNFFKNLVTNIFNNPLMKTVGTWIKNVVKNLAAHFFTGTREALAKATSKLWGLLKGPVGTVKSLFNSVWRFLKGLLSSGPVKAVTGLFSKVWGFLKGPIATMGDFAQKWIGKAGKFADNALVFVKGLPQMLMEKAGKVLEAVLKKPFEIIQKLADLPIFKGIKGAVDGLKGIFKSTGAVGKILGGAKGAVGKSVAKIGGKAGLQAAGMSIPIFGSAIGLAAGIYETQRMGRKYGWNAKTIGAGLAYTAVQTGAGFAGTGVGIAAAIAGEVALNQFENRVLKVELVGADQQAQLSMRNKNAADQAMEVTRLASDYQ